MVTTGTHDPLDGLDPQSGLRRRFRAAPSGGSDTLVVVQSQARVVPPRFGLERLFATTRHACLFLDCPDSAWYLGCEAATDAAIDAALAVAAPSRIIHYGASKGAYGALSTALRRGDGTAYAFGPEFELGQPGTQSGLYRAPGQPGEPDLVRALAETRTPHPLTLVFGLHDPVDAAGFARLARVPLPPAVALLALRSPHASHDHLYTLNIIRKLIARFDRDLAGLCDERGLISQEGADTAGAFATAGHRLATGDPPDPDALAGDLVPALNPGHGLLLAECLLAAGRAAEAAGILREAITLTESAKGLAAQPKRWRKQFWRELIQALARAGDASGAGETAREALARFPDDADLAALADRVAGRDA
uniref:hypothetical protein n=1 Tax=Stappia sp. TaxID=1870903 RepID=UPI003BA8FDBC